MSPLQRSANPRLESRLAQGIRAFELQRGDEALDCFRRVTGEAIFVPEAWFWMGRCHEERGQRAEAGYCYTLATLCHDQHQPSLDALRRLGLIDPR